MDIDKDFLSYCRLCLDIESKHISIFTDSSVSTHVRSCLDINISVDDNLPKDICETCVSQLNSFYNFQLNARCSQDWLESILQEKQKAAETKTFVQPLPDSEYNSDSLLEFLNNTENIEEYLNNLGKEDIPVIVNMLDRTEGNTTSISKNQFSPKKSSKTIDNMDIDVLDSEKEVVKEILMKDSEKNKSEQSHLCFACQTVTNNIQELSKHLSICDSASRTCVLCKTLFDSKQKMLQHILTHNITAPMTCTCGKLFETKEALISHIKYCNIDHIAAMGFVYRCKKCGVTYPERFQLYRHVKKHILQEEERMCDICGHILNGTDALLNHHKVQHGKSNNILYKCKKCTNFTTLNRKEMYRHIQTQHTDKDTRHLCDTCGRCFSSQVTLHRHLTTHNQNNMCTVKGMENINRFHKEFAMCDRCGTTVNTVELPNHTCC
ncbi:zinc finger protein 37-like [Leptidea sinapis]|uniref:zinc finger protein 37-like n=1 Tax=Leptidea sinapis TaxID=189913 RepID=UPI002139583C|nr:zinc finger protein 37-like [Leptidea sinapis]